LTIDQFLTIAETWQVTEKDLKWWRPAAATDEEDEEVIIKDHEWFGGRVSKGLHEQIADGEKIADGGRHNFLVKVARYLHFNKKLDQIGNYDEHWCDPPLGNSIEGNAEIDSIVQWTEQNIDPDAEASKVKEIPYFAKPDGLYQIKYDKIN